MVADTVKPPCDPVVVLIAALTMRTCASESEPFGGVRRKISSALRSLALSDANRPAPSMRSIYTPGSYPVTEGLTVRMAIAKGGGVNENGSEKKVKLVRDGKTLNAASSYYDSASKNSGN